MTGRKLLCTLFLAPVLLLGAGAPARAIDFKVSGEWLVGFGAGTGELYSKYREPCHGPKTRTNTNDIFEANQRLRLQLDAVASESLSGTVASRSVTSAGHGGALGADSSKVIKLKNACIDWAVPSTTSPSAWASRAWRSPTRPGARPSWKATWPALWRATSSRTS